MERAAGDAVLAGPYTLRALTARQDEVGGALDGPGGVVRRQRLSRSEARYESDARGGLPRTFRPLSWY
jgi:hypothetical protein